MNRFLLGALAMGAVFVLTSFAGRGAADPVKRTGGPAWKVSEYQLDRAFRIPLAYNGTAPIAITGQVPAGGGFIITQLGQFGGFTTSIDINGITENFSGGSSTIIELNPPIIARPGDVVTFTYQGGPTIAGYTTLPGET